MTAKCTSQIRCSLITCERCARRFSNRVARRILATSPRNLFALQIDAALPSLAAFWCWRVEARNWIDHRRRASAFWKSVGLYVWLSQDRWLRGVIALNALTKDEAEIGLSRRWPITLQQIDHTDLSHHLYAAVRPSVISISGPVQARYQPRKLAIGPRGKLMLTGLHPSRTDQTVEPMPVLI
jgi:hypothetical protein